MTKIICDRCGDDVLDDGQTVVCRDECFDLCGTCKKEYEQEYRWQREAMGLRLHAFLLAKPEPATPPTGTATMPNSTAMRDEAAK